MNLVELKTKNISELMDVAKTFEIEGATGMRKQDLIFSILQSIYQAGIKTVIYPSDISIFSIH